MDKNNSEGKKGLKMAEEFIKFADKTEKPIKRFKEMHRTEDETDAAESIRFIESQKAREQTASGKVGKALVQGYRTASTKGGITRSLYKRQRQLPKYNSRYFKGKAKYQLNALQVKALQNQIEKMRLQRQLQRMKSGSQPRQINPELLQKLKEKQFYDFCFCEGDVMPSIVDHEVCSGAGAFVHDGARAAAEIDREAFVNANIANFGIVQNIDNEVMLNANIGHLDPLFSVERDVMKFSNILG